MAIKDFPSTVKINAADWSIESRTQQFTSELNGVVQTVALPGDRWAGVLTFSNKTGAEARALIAFLVSLRGRSGRFRIRPPRVDRTGSATSGGTVTAINADGTVTVSGVVSPVPTCDSTLFTADYDGVTVDAATVAPVAFAAGDYIEINGELKMVTEDVDAVSGVAVIPVAPTPRSAATGTDVTISNPTAVMALADDDQARWSTSPLPIYAMSVAVVEATDI